VATLVDEALERVYPRLWQRRGQQDIVGHVHARGPVLAGLGRKLLDALAEQHRLDFPAERGRLAENAQRVFLELALVML
jgi:hypothetical protein